MALCPCLLNELLSALDRISDLNTWDERRGRLTSPFREVWLKGGI